MSHTMKWSDEIKLGNYTLPNRICMAALTRQRCDPLTGIPNKLMADYYNQRSGAGLMLTEAVAWSQRGEAFPGAGCLFNEEQMNGWKDIVQQVTQKDCKLYIQLFHAGRASHPALTRGLQPWAPSALPVRETIRALEGVPYPTPKEMTLEDIETVKREYQHSVILAKKCSFSGVQLHGAHGYLVDEFLRSASNQRTDSYGGSIVNRCRLCLELIDITLKHFEPYQIGIKVSPASRLRDMFDADPVATFSFLLDELSKRNVGFVQIRESTEQVLPTNCYGITAKEQMSDVGKPLRPHFNGLLIANDSFDPVTGLERIQAGECHMVSFGRYYVSNPDLAERIINGWPLAQWDYKTFYVGGPNGYNDYPSYEVSK